MRNSGLEETQTEIKIARININNFKYADDTTLMAEREGEQKSLLMKVKEEWKSWLKDQHSENEGHGIGPILSLEINGERVETVSDFIFLGYKIIEMVNAAMKLKDAYSLEEKLWPIYIAYSKAETLLCRLRSV